MEYPDAEALSECVGRIRRLPPLVTSGEIERLRTLIAEAQRGERFLLQGGDCAERLEDCTPNAITGKLKILLQVSLVLLYATRKPVIRVGRWAGQFAKPRSSATQTRLVNGRPLTLPSYYGDLVNGEEFSADARRPDPQRLVDGYTHAGLTLNFIRSLIQGGFADIHHPEHWDLSFLRQAGLPDGLRDEYSSMIAGMLAWLAAEETGARAGRAGTGRLPVDELERVEFFASHEGLNLHYESAQTRRVPRRDGWYDLTTHFPWIGERTRGPGGAHAEFFRGIRNPIGIKVGPRVGEAGGADELLDLIAALNPANEPGRIVLIARLGAPETARILPGLIERVRRAEHVVLWTCDPMHGNTKVLPGPRVASAAATAVTAGAAGSTSRLIAMPQPSVEIDPDAGIKTRLFADIAAELETSWRIHREMGSRLGGLHIEVTGEDVTECLGGAGGITPADLARRYETACDPRLNYEQAIELAMGLGKLLRE